MKNRFSWVLIAAALLAMCFAGAVSAKSGSPGDGGWTQADKESYLTEAQLAFIRPGLVVEVLDVTIPDDRQPVVTFTIADPAGLPLDLDGVFTPGPIRMLMTLSHIPVGEEAYVAYTTQVATSPITGESATQASYDRGGVYTQLEPGKYTYKFATVLPDGYAMDATTSLGVQARRSLGEFELGDYVENVLYHFIPSGDGVAVPRDITSTTTCNRCHDPLSLHGGWRTDVGVCVLCHNPTQSIDPDTMDSVDMPYMTHKIHAGAHLEHGYTIIGYRQSVHDYSHVEFPAELNDCQVCHTGGTPTEDFPLVSTPAQGPVCDGSRHSTTQISWGDMGKISIRLEAEDGKTWTNSNGAGKATTGKWVNDGMEFFAVDRDTGEVLAELPVYNTVLGCTNNAPGTFRGDVGEQHTNWLTNPSRMACGSCHDDVDFESGEDHPAQADDSRCNVCHAATRGNEYDISVMGAHTVEYRSRQLDGFIVEILDIQDTDPGDKPMIVFAMRSKSGPIMPWQLDRIRFSLSGPNDDYNFYVTETATAGLQPFGANWSYRFAASLPTDAMGSYTLGVEGRIEALINEGEDDEFETEDQLQNFTEAFAVTDAAPVTRREIVTDYKCESCHANLSLHGSNRHDANGYCQTCHNPQLTDARVRPAGTGEPESVDFRYMIHKIHRGEHLENGYVVYGYRSSLHDYSHVEYPGDLRNCEACHDGDSYTLPLNSGLEPVNTPAEPWTPMLPETAACVSCHDSSGAKAHADSNTTDVGEACSACHGSGKTFSVERVHAR